MLGQSMHVMHRLQAWCLLQDVDKYAPETEVHKYLHSRLTCFDTGTLYELHYQMITLGKVPPLHVCCLYLSMNLAYVLHDAGFLHHRNPKLAVCHADATACQTRLCLEIELAHMHFVSVSTSSPTCMLAPPARLVCCIHMLSAFQMREHGARLAHQSTLGAGSGNIVQVDVYQQSMFLQPNTRKW